MPGRQDFKQRHWSPPRAPALECRRRVPYKSLRRGRSSVVERQLPKLNVVGSIPIARSISSLTAAKASPQGNAVIAGRAARSNLRPPVKAAASKSGGQPVSYDFNTISILPLDNAAGGRVPKGGPEKDASVSRVTTLSTAFAPSRGGYLNLTLVLMAFAAAAALQFLYVLPNHDSVWLLVAAERMLDGGTYTEDFSEINPPLAILLHAPSFFVRSVSGLDPYPAFIVLVLAYTAVSLLLLQVVVANGFPPAGDLKRWLLPIVAVLFLLLPSYDFGQREHLFSIFVIPYLALHATKLPGHPESRGLTILVSAVACLGLFLKPVFLLLPILISLERAIRLRAPRSFISLDMIVIGVMGLVYTAVVLIRFPGFFPIARYALELYGAYDGDSLVVAPVAAGYALVGVALALFGVRIAESPAERRMFMLLTLAAGVAAGSVIMQRKGWSYHMLPIGIFIGISALMMAVIASTRIRRSATNRAFALVGKIAPFLIVALLLQSTYWDSEQTSRQDLVETELYSELESVAARKRLYVVSSGVREGTPWVATIHANWASRFSALWLVPGYAAAVENGALSAAQQEMLAKDIRRTVEEDFERYRPEVVLVDRREDMLGFKGPFDLLGFLSAGDRFAMIWKSYSFHKAVDGFDIYLLSDRTGTDGSAPGGRSVPAAPAQS